MHYVKQFNINGVATKQVACIELQGAPNAATEGAVGVLGMDMLSPTHEVYRCVAVNGSVYTWELLSAGMSIISATITGEGGESKAFPYSALRVPNNYLIKRGDLILDSEGYLYQITAIGGESCDTTYCGTHIGGIANGDKDYSLVAKNGKLQLVTESGSVISNVDYLNEDGDTLTRDSSTGMASVRGIKTINDESLRLFVGTKAEYEALTDVQKQNLFAIITDDTSRADIINDITKRLTSGNIVPAKSQDVEHLYYHKCRLTIPVFLRAGAGDVSGEVVFEFEFTSPRATVDSTKFLMSKQGTKLYWSGVYYPNDTTYADKYEVTAYTYLGMSSNTRYMMADFTLSTGAVNQFGFLDFTREISTIELY